MEIKQKGIFMQFKSVLFTMLIVFTICAEGLADNEGKRSNIYAQNTAIVSKQVNQNKLADLINEQGWQVIRFEFSKSVGPMNWSAGIKILAFHDHPDKNSRTGLPLFLNRHINQDSSLPEYPLVTRDSRGMDEDTAGVHVSIAALPGGELYQENDKRTAHQRDWDFIASERDIILKEKGLFNSKDTLAKLKVLGDYVQSRRGGNENYPSRHPVDFLLHSSYCTGASNTMVGFATTMGLKARTINTSVHSTIEVEVEGKWYFIDNSKSLKYSLVENMNFMQVSAFPENIPALSCESDAAPKTKKRFYGSYKLHGDDYVFSGSAYNLAAGVWHMNQCGTGQECPVNSQTILNGAGLTVGLDATTAKALYPGDKEIWVRATDNGAVMIAGKYCWWRSAMNLKQGEKIRRFFYLGEIKNPENPLNHLEAQVLIAPDGTGNFDANGKGWMLKVNGCCYKLDDGSIKWKHVKAMVDYPDFYADNPLGIKAISEEYLSFYIPVTKLKENSLNCIEFGSEIKGDGVLPVIMFPDPVLPYYPPFTPGPDGALQKEWIILPDHICEVLQVKMGFKFPAKTPCKITIP